MAIYFNEKLDCVFYALGDSTRREILEFISRNGEQTATSFVKLFDFKQPTISKHLKVLEKAKLIKRRIDGRTHLFDLDSGTHLAMKWLTDNFEFWNRSLESLESLERLDELLSEEEL